VATPSVNKGAPPAVPSSTPGGEVHVQHIYSPSPLIIAVGLLFLYLGFELVLIPVGPVKLPVFLLLGIALFGIGIINWIREDVHFWNVNWVDHGVLPGHELEWWGILFFLGTEVMLFGGLFAMYFVGQGEHPPLWDAGHAQLSVGATAINTAILILSSVTYGVSEHYIGKQNRRNAILWQVITIVLGLVFLARQILEYVGLVHDGFVIQKDQYWSAFYMLTGTHGFHVFLGLSLITIGFVRTAMGHFTPERHTYLKLAGYYWHFVDVVWIFLFSVIYLRVL
jgi:heme/copper-type cytochrome/quinol oxidase subunit 3